MEIPLLLSLLTPFLCCVSGVNTLSLFEKPGIEAIYQFGDSMADTGNILREDASFHSSKFPYGETFFHHPTGRCSDGRLIVDFFAQALQLPFLDPYLDKEGNFTHGVNFAVAGATALNVSTLAAKNISITTTQSSLLVQLGWFRSHFNSLHCTPSECKKKLGNALFLVGTIGGNDYYQGTFQSKTVEDLYVLVPEIIHTIINVVKELIEFGAKRIIVLGNFAIGCMTVYLDLFKTNDSTMYDELNCLRGWNEFAIFHNDQLQNAIKDLQKEHLDVTILYGNYYNALVSILRHLPSLGFEEDGWQKACCGIHVNKYKKWRCGSIGAPLCSDPSKRVSWDGVHFTQHANQLMANWLLKYIFPISIQAG